MIETSPSRKKLLLVLRIYGFYLLLVWAAILFYRHNPYYKGFLSADTQHLLLLLAAGYSLSAPFFYLLTPLKYLSQSKGLIIPQALYRLARQSWYYLATFARKPSTRPPKLAPKERTAVLFIVVKLFFLPLMINYLFGNYFDLKNAAGFLNIDEHLLSINTFNIVIFPLLFSLFLLVDTAYFVFGYSVESRFLRNRVKSVDPTYSGWLVALISYPPLNGVLSGYVPWYANNYAAFADSKATALMRLFVLIFMGIYASASVSLGAKASNLTNRGIVGWGAYRWVRHPAYISKNIAWWITILPVFSLTAAVSMLIWSTVYFLRAITEERHLIRDPDYQAYCKKVRWRFIPGVV